MAFVYQTFSAHQWKNNTLTSLPAALFAIGLSACGDTAKLSEKADEGPQPQIVDPVTSLIPTLHIAPAKGWPEGVVPKAAEGLEVNAYASGLDHPPWLYTLPNGDVLVAESNAPKKLSGV